MAIELGIIGLSSCCAGGLAAANVVATIFGILVRASLCRQFYLQANVVAAIFAIGPSVLRATSGLAEQLRETTIFGIFPHVTLLAFTPEGIVVGF